MHQERPRVSSSAGAWQPDAATHLEIPTREFKKSNLPNYSGDQPGWYEKNTLRRLFAFQKLDHRLGTLFTNEVRLLLGDR